MNPYRTTEKQYRVEDIHINIKNYNDSLEEQLNLFYDNGYELFSILKKQPTTNPAWYTILLKKRT